MTETTAHPAATADASTHEKPRYDDINVTTVVIVGFVSAVITVLTILFVKGLLGIWLGRFERMRAEDTVNAIATQEIQHQRAMLDGTHGTMSVEEASKKVIETFGK